MQGDASWTMTSGKHDHSPQRKEYKYYSSSDPSIPSESDVKQTLDIETQPIEHRTPERKLKDLYIPERSPTETLDTSVESKSPSYIEFDIDVHDDLSEGSYDGSITERDLIHDFDQIIQEKREISIATVEREDILSEDILDQYIEGDGSHDNDLLEDDIDEPQSLQEVEGKSKTTPFDQGDDFLISFDAEVDDLAAHLNEIHESNDGYEDESMASHLSMLSHDDDNNVDDQSKGHSISEVSLGQRSNSSLFFQKRDIDKEQGEGDEYSLYSPVQNLNWDTRSFSRRSMFKGSSNRSILKPAKPTANNAFETLPRHLINSGLLRQGVSTLRDLRFVERRIIKLGAVYASKVHVHDFECLRKVIVKDAKRLEDEFSGLEATLPSSSTFADGDNFYSVTKESFDIFESLIFQLCGIPIVYSNDGIITKPARNSHQNDHKIDLADGGRALYNIGKFYEKLDQINHAMILYRHALYLYFLDIHIEEVRLVDNADDCDGYFYVHAARSGIKSHSTITHRYVGAIFTKMGDLHEKLGEKNNALRAYRASQVFWRHYLENNPITPLESVGTIEEDDKVYDHIAAVEAFALSLNRIGAVYTAKGDLDSALASFHEALDFQVKALGPNHVEVAKTIHNIGVCHRHIGDWDQALEFYQKAYEIFEKSLGRDHLDSVRTLHNIGGVYRRRKEYDKAMNCFVEVLDVRRRHLGDNHPSVSITLVSMAAVLRRQGRKKEAQKFYSAAVH